MFYVKVEGTPLLQVTMSTRQEEKVISYLSKKLGNSMFYKKDEDKIKHSLHSLSLGMASFETCSGSWWGLLLPLFLWLCISTRQASPLEFLSSPFFIRILIMIGVLTIIIMAFSVMSVIRFLCGGPALGQPASQSSRKERQTRLICHPCYFATELFCQGTNLSLNYFVSEILCYWVTLSLRY